MKEQNTLISTWKTNPLLAASLCDRNKEATASEASGHLLPTALLSLRFFFPPPGLKEGRKDGRRRDGAEF